MKNITFAFVSYFPNDKFYSRVKTLLKYRIPVWIYLNSDPDCDVLLLKEEYPNDLALLGRGENDGLGIGMHEIFSRAFNAGFKYLIFFDQDTGFSERTVEFVVDYDLDSLFNKEYSVIQMNGCEDVLVDEDKITSINDVLLTINSGSIFDLNIANRLGYHSKDFFVDGVDYEYCLRSFNHGFKCGKVYFFPDLDHRTEQGDSVVQIASFKVRLRKYPFFRVIDYNKAQLKLIRRSLLTLNFRFLAKFVRQWFVYNVLTIVSWLIIRR